MDLGSMLGKGADAANVSALADLLTKHKDDLAATAQIARDLPRLLTLLASGLADAGDHAARAGRALSGASGATGRVGNSAATVGQISGNLNSVGRLITTAADEIAKVPMMGTPAGHFAAAAKTVGDSIAGLDDLSRDLSEISGPLATRRASSSADGERQVATTPPMNNAAANRPDANSITIDSPVAFRAAFVDGQAWLRPRRFDSASHTPPTKPMNSPMTGITKNPTMPRTTPSTNVRRGTPASFSRRCGTAYLMTAPTARTTTPDQAMPQASPVFVEYAQTSRAPAMISTPGRTGTTMPSRPIRIATAQRTSTHVTWDHRPARSGVYGALSNEPA
jgi:hypothetical protein